jgi:hypothetical protein
MKRKAEDSRVEYDLSYELVLDRALEIQTLGLIAELHAASPPKRPRCGLLRPLNTAFAFAENPVTQSGRHYATSSSLDIGRRVHAELEAAAHWHPPMLLVDPRSLHPMTRAILARLDSLGWRVIGSEVPLYDPTSGIETRADLLAYDRSAQRVVLIEIKTGRDNGYKARLYNRVFQLPVIAPAYDSHETRAHLQLCWMDWFLRRHVSRLHSVVLRADASGSHAPEPLKKWARAKQPAIVAAIGEAARAAPVY